MMLALQGLWSGKNDGEIISSMSNDNRFRFFATPAPIRDSATSKRSFSAGTKSAAFVNELVQNGVRCGICNGLLHRNSMTTDHIERKVDGGSAHSSNAQVTHPYCNTTFKEVAATFPRNTETLP